MEQLAVYKTPFKEELVIGTTQSPYYTMTLNTLHVLANFITITTI